MVVISVSYFRINELELLVDINNIKENSLFLINLKNILYYKLIFIKLILFNPFIIKYHK